MAFTFTVRGEPAPQGSKSGFYNQRLKRVMLVESSSKCKPWRQEVMAAAIAAREAAGFAGDLVPMFEGPVHVTATFTVKKAKSAPKRIRTFPVANPDLDKLVRSTLDAMTKAGIFRDDSYVVELSSAKRFPNEGTDSLDTLGAVISVVPIS